MKHGDAGGIDSIFTDDWHVVDSKFDEYGYYDATNVCQFVLLKGKSGRFYHISRDYAYYDSVLSGSKWEIYVKSLLVGERKIYFIPDPAVFRFDQDYVVSTPWGIKVINETLF